MEPNAARSKYVPAKNPKPKPPFDGRRITAGIESFAEPMMNHVRVSQRGMPFPDCFSARTRDHISCRGQTKGFWCSAFEAGRLGSVRKEHDQGFCTPSALLYLFQIDQTTLQDPWLTLVFVVGHTPANSRFPALPPGIRSFFVPWVFWWKYRKVSHLQFAATGLLLNPSSHGDSCLLRSPCRRLDDSPNGTLIESQRHIPFSS